MEKMMVKIKGVRETSQRNQSVNRIRIIHQRHTGELTLLASFVLTTRRAVFCFRFSYFIPSLQGFSSQLVVHHGKYKMDFTQYQE